MAVITAAAVTAAGTAYAANKSSKAAKAQINANKDAQDITRQAAREAKGEAKELFDRGLQRQAQGFSQSRDLLAGGLMPQANMMNQGNLNAQNTLLGGGQGFMSAILGSGGDPYANLQAQQVTPDFSYLTDFVQQQNEAAAQQPEQPNISPFQAQGVPDWVSQMRDANPNASIDANGRVIQGGNGGLNFRGFGSSLDPQTLQNIYNAGGVPTFGSGMGGAGQAGGLFSSTLGGTNNTFKPNNNGSLF